MYHLFPQVSTIWWCFTQQTGSLMSLHPSPPVINFWNFRININTAMLTAVSSQNMICIYDRIIVTILMHAKNHDTILYTDCSSTYQSSLAITITLIYRNKKKVLASSPFHCSSYYLLWWLVMEHVTNNYILKTYVLVIC